MKWCYLLTEYDERNLFINGKIQRPHHYMFTKLSPIYLRATTITLSVPNILLDCMILPDYSVCLVSLFANYLKRFTFHISQPALHFPYHLTHLFLQTPYTRRLYFHTPDRDIAHALQELSYLQPPH